MRRRGDGKRKADGVYCALFALICVVAVIFMAEFHYFNGEGATRHGLRRPAFARRGDGVRVGQKPIWDVGLLSAPLDYADPLPPAVQAFREGKVDWHDSLPKHSSLWQRFGGSKDAQFNFMQLVLKEEAMTDYLTQFAEGGLRGLYGKDHGILSNYTGCNLLQDACNVHAAETCASDSFCAWNRGACAEKPMVDDSEALRLAFAKCKAPHLLVGDAFLPVADAHAKRVAARKGENSTEVNATFEPLCTNFIDESVFALQVPPDPAAMFFHWWHFFAGVHADFARRQKAITGHLRTQVLVREPVENTQFFHYFGLISKSCWRRPRDVPKGTCFCGAPPKQTLVDSPTENARLLDVLVDRFGLRLQPKPEAIRVGIISRRRKRFLLNEHALVRACLDLGFEVVLLPLETMTLYEQLAALRATTVLVGVHGSGLNNAIFLPPGAAVLQLLPFGLSYRGAFQRNAEQADVEYAEWQLQDSAKSVFHWEFLGERRFASGKAAILAKPSPLGGQEVYTFWINQDMIVPLDEFNKALLDAIEKSPLNSVIANTPTGQDVNHTHVALLVESKRRARSKRGYKPKT
ncbi:hypothetical protein M885DRAFT_512615 [Pelagophyceae sp. CCMP2097]|nr:hypothetical protein M885DRAFT_512615 [Pelagophyceae sp. CCMP2097]